MKAKTLGKVQLLVGIIFLILIIIGSVYAVKKVYVDNLLFSFKQITAAEQDFKELNKNIDIKATGYAFHFISYIVIIRTIALFTGTLFIMCAIISVMLSIMLIMQGLAKTKEL